MTDNRGDDMNHRRLVGIDLGSASAHAVRALDGQGTTLAKREALPTVESPTQIETAALAGTPAGPRQAEDLTSPVARNLARRWAPRAGRRRAGGSRERGVCIGVWTASL
jgi:hypothetical protein